MDVKGYEKILKTKSKILHKISSKQKSRRWTYIQKLQNSLRKIKEKTQAKLLFKPIRKTQKQCKTTIAGLEINDRKVLKNNFLQTTLETENGIISDENTIAKEFNVFY